MSKKTKVQDNNINDEQLVAALNQLFTAGKWEIPDDAVAGKVAAQVQQLQARVDHLTDEVARLAGVKSGKPAPRSRVDALSAVDKKEKGATK